MQQGEDKRDYAGSVIYENSSLKRVLVDGGYAEKEGDNWKYCFYFNDHLGNNAVVADQDGNAIQNNSYYPFGLPMATASDSIQGLQPYKYNGKEFERKDGLKLYDYGARHYDAQVGRFTTVDPLAEKYYAWSPYVYCMNNPINYIDPFGLDPVYRDGKYYEDDGSEVSWEYVYNWMTTNNHIAATYYFKTTSSSNAQITETQSSNKENAFYVNGQKYIANSYATLMGKDDSNNNVGDFNGIYTIDAARIYLILGHAAYIFYDEYMKYGLANIETAILLESIRGKLDYKLHLQKLFDVSPNSNYLYEINGKVYNVNEAGNYLWGMVLNYYGSFLSPNKLAELGSRGRNDEPWEQRAITDGRSYGTQLLQTVNPTIKQQILHWRLEMRLFLNGK